MQRQGQLLPAAGGGVGPRLLLTGVHDVDLDRETGGCVHHQVQHHRPVARVAAERSRQRQFAIGQHRLVVRAVHELVHVDHPPRVDSPVAVAHARLLDRIGERTAQRRTGRRHLLERPQPAPLDVPLERPVVRGGQHRAERPERARQRVGDPERLDTGMVVGQDGLLRVPLDGRLHVDQPQARERGHRNIQRQVVEVSPVCVLGEDERSRRKFES